MSAQHTTGRVTFREDGDANHWSMLTEDGRWLLAILHNGEAPSERQVANFRRLAAAWNACEGIDTEDLEAGSVSIIQKLHDEASKDVLAQRDELLAMLNQAVRRLESAHARGETIMRHWIVDARALIAKVKGETS